jgi:hypothetical protein
MSKWFKLAFIPGLILGLSLGFSEKESTLAKEKSFILPAESEAFGRLTSFYPCAVVGYIHSSVEVEVVIEERTEEAVLYEEEGRELDIECPTTGGQIEIHVVNEGEKPVTITYELKADYENVEDEEIELEVKS